MKLDYDLTSTKERLDYVNELIKSRGVKDSDFVASEFNSYELNAVGNYLLYTYEKENKLKRITDNDRYREEHEQVQIDYQNGIKSYVHPKKDKMKYPEDKQLKLKSYDEFIIPSKIQEFALSDLKNKVNRMSVKECESYGLNKGSFITSINGDIKELRTSFSKYFEVKSKNEFIINRHDRRESQYSIKTIERVLANHSMMKNLYTKHLDSDVFCTYQDVMAALERCYEFDLFTNRQKVLIEELIRYGHVHHKYYETLHRALKKIKKMI